ncbi:MAG TPA: cytidylate kinase-like family protein, partial [Desulfatiglandales bacterium]|nr:cytidylate kinase-like family protein [Desulfatiglandales bacterium]
ANRQGFTAMAILTISREFRSGGQEIGTAVAERMRYDYVGKERILSDLRGQGDRWIALLNEVDEDRPTVWDRFDWEYRGLMALMESYIYDRAMDDRVVLVGRGANFLLQGIPYALHVRLTAPMEQRIDRVMRKDNVNRKNAILLIEKMDNDRASFIRANFHRDWYDLTWYDMVFNTAVQTFEEITDIVCNALQEKTGKLTLEGWEMLRGRMLAARIRAHIATNPKIKVPTLKVFFDGKSIILQGVVRRICDVQVIGEIVTVSAQGTPVRNELRYGI